MANEWKFSASLERFEKGLYKLHLKVPLEIALEVESYRKDRRVYCTLKKMLSFHTALMYEHGIYYIMLNREKQNTLQIEPGDLVDIQLEECKNRYGIDLPGEMVEALQMDSVANRLFHNLTPGKQRSLFHLIDKIKSPKLRADRSWLVLEHLVENAGESDFKVLHRKFKEDRQK